jgi:hypothetical protein
MPGIIDGAEEVGNPGLGGRQHLCWSSADPYRLERSPIGTEPGGRGIGIDWLGSGRAPADLDRVDGPSESGLVGVWWVATDDEHAPRGIEPALEVVVHALAANESSPPRKSGNQEAGRTYGSPLTISGDIS